MGERVSPLAKAVRDGRARLGWAQSDLSHASGVSEATVAKIEQGVRSKPHASTLSALESALQFAPGVLADVVRRDECVPVSALLASDSPLSMASTHDLILELSHRVHVLEAENRLLRGGDN
ncbi:helix-turn-helix domain-containing protein [Auritidibacter ignavus]|uniref:helix-turn-helix domain-containing protein n=1 Tax=Auritidibacter ignavus TaxID=678932 RepID=UPI001C7EBF03|nr:helix-turn-helix domain-containing protein [Auritidibacter ignavus]